VEKTPENRLSTLIVAAAYRTPDKAGRIPENTKTIKTPAKQTAPGVSARGKCHQCRIQEEELNLLPCLQILHGQSPARDEQGIRRNTSKCMMICKSAT